MADSVAIIGRLYSRRLGFFGDHLALVDRFLDRQQTIVERIEQALLNVRDRDTSRRRDRPFFERTFTTCFFGLPDLPGELVRLKGQLAARHLADGFEPVASENTFVNELDPLELILRAYEHWERSRWPGRSGRLSYAGTLYTVFMLRLLEGLSLRIWDDEAATAQDRLDDLQRRLDRLNGAGFPVFVRDAAWLIQTSQGPLTKHLRPYLDVADRIAGSLTGPRGVAVHKAGARLAGGHLRSQRRYRAWVTNRPADDPENLAFTRTTNALDGALLVRDLVPLLEAYRTACSAHDADARLELADAILQGVSADPDLYLTRLDLLGPYLMIEDLFIQHVDGMWRHTAMGESHRQTLSRYESLIGECAPFLLDDAGVLNPSGCPYSPLGITYGFIADVMSNIAQDRLMGHASFDLGLEDMFVSRGELESKRARAIQWQALPRRPGEQVHFDHSEEAAAESHGRLTRALVARATHPTALNASGRRHARVFLTSDAPPEAVNVDEYCVTSSPLIARPNGPARYPADQLLIDRSEGRYLASAQGDDGEWFGISKAILTMFTSAGTDVVMTCVPLQTAEVFRVTGKIFAEPGPEPMST